MLVSRKKDEDYSNKDIDEFVSIVDEFSIL